MTLPGAWIDKFSGVRIACVGDVMLDRYVYGVVERISPEAPIPVLKVEREVEMLGGAGNVARNACELGAQVELFACIGPDAPGRTIEALARSTPGLSATLIPAAGTVSTVKTRYSAGNQQILRADHEATGTDVDSHLPALRDWLATVLPRTDVVILSDYSKGALTAPTIELVIGAARQAGRPVLVDPKGSAYERYRGATLLSPNWREFTAATGCAVVADMEQAARALIQRVGCAALLITRGEAGMALIERDGAARSIEAQAREVFDVSGAGDTVIATAAVALASGAALRDAAALANAAAGLVVGKRGTATVTPDELRHALRREDVDHVDAKVVSLAEALVHAGAMRTRGARIGFTNGCFDLVHPGHVALLRQARARCDCLIVGLNSDASVRRLKGPARPVQDEIARATVLASMQDVDLVVLFDTDTPLDLIVALAPDVLFKGADYRRDEVVGAEVVERAGGRVELIALVPDTSTSRLVERMRE